MGTHDDEQRLAHLAEEELPALIARFEQSGLGELEIHRDDWKVRLLRSVPLSVAEPEPTLRRGRWAPGQATGGPAAAAGSRESGAPGPSAALRDPAASHDPASRDPGASRDPAAPGPSAANMNGAHGGALSAVGPGRAGEPGDQGRRRVATSPAVGYFSPLDGLSSGHPVRSGDLLGHVDVLGVRQEVVAPMDGIVVRVLAEAGQAVEYGEELVRVDVTGPRPAADG